MMAAPIKIITPFHKEIVKACGSRRKPIVIQTQVEELLLHTTYWDEGVRNTWFCIEQVFGPRDRWYINQFPQWDPPQYGGPERPTCRLTEQNAVVCISSRWAPTIYLKGDR